MKLKAETAKSRSSAASVSSGSRGKASTGTKSAGMPTQPNDKASGAKQTR
jgi:hypothetical protein